MKVGFRLWVLIIVLALSLLAMKPSFDTGVVVKSVDKDSPAFLQGLKQGEIIKQIDGKVIENKEDYANYVENLFITGEEKRVDLTTKENTYTFLTNESLA